jgi:hypothetical protein
MTRSNLTTLGHDDRQARRETDERRTRTPTAIGWFESPTVWRRSSVGRAQAQEMRDVLESASLYGRVSLTRFAALD